MSGRAVGELRRVDRTGVDSFPKAAEVRQVAGFRTA